MASSASAVLLDRASRDYAPARATRPAERAAPRAERSLGRGETLAMGGPLTAAFIGLLLLRTDEAAATPATVEGDGAESGRPHADLPSARDADSAMASPAASPGESVVLTAADGADAGDFAAPTGGGFGAETTVVEPTTLPSTLTVLGPDGQPVGLDTVLFAGGGIELTMGDLVGMGFLLPDTEPLPDLLEPPLNPTGVFIDARNTGSLELVGTAADDVIIGNDHGNVIHAGAGDDWISTGGGNNVVHLVAGNNQVFGGAGNDTIHGGAGNDTVFAGAGDDVIHGGAGFNTLHGEQGDDTYVIDASLAALDSIVDRHGFNTLQVANATRDDLRFAYDPASQTLAMWVGDGPGGLRAVITQYDLVDSQFRLVVDGEAVRIPDVALGPLNHAPIVRAELGGLATLEGQAFAVVVPIEDIDPGEVLTFSATLGDGSALPAWLTLDTATGQLAGTAGAGDVGVYEVRVVATDSFGLSAETTFTLDVAAAPPGGGTDPHLILGTPGADVLYGTAADNTIFGFGGDDVIYAVAGNNEIHTGSGNNTVYGGTGNDTIFGGAGNDTIETGGGNNYVSAGGGFNQITGGAGNDTYHVDFAVVGIDRIVDQGGSNVLLLDNVAFADIDWVIIDWSTVPGADATGFEVQGWVGGSARFVLADFDPSQTSYSVRIGDDTYGIPGLNQAPQVVGAMPNVSIGVGGALGLAVPAGLFVDRDAGDTLTIDASGLPDWMGFDGTGFTGQPGITDLGAYEVTLTATDPAGLAASTSFTVQVVGENRPPVAGEAPTLPEAVPGEAFSYILPASLFVDPDFGDALTWTVVQADGSPLPDWLTFDPATRTLSGTPDAAGPLALKAVATDLAGASAEVALTLPVTVPNAPPEPGAPLPDLGATAGEAWTATLPAGAFVDPDGDALTFTATVNGVPVAAVDWLQIDEATGALSGTPPVPGAYLVEVVAIDVHGAASAPVGFTLAVAPASLPDNQPPEVVGALPDLDIGVGGTLGVTVPAGLFTDPDLAAGDALTIQASGLPAWMSFDGTRFAGQPGIADLGSYEVTLTATDTGGLSASTAFTVEVTGENRPPVAGEAPTLPEAVAGQPFVYVLPASLFVDPDFGDTLSWSVVQADGAPLPDWLQFDAATRTLSGTPDASGPLALKAVATDLGGASAEVGLSLEVSAPPPVNQPPVADPDTVLPAATAGAAWSLDLGTVFSDPDGDPLSYAVTLDGVPVSAVPWLTLGADGILSGTPPDAAAHVLAVTADDGRGGTVGASFDFGVAPAPPPAWEPPAFDPFVPLPLNADGSISSQSVPQPNQFVQPTNAGGRIFYQPGVAYWEVPGFSAAEYTQSPLELVRDNVMLTSSFKAALFGNDNNNFFVGNAGDNFLYGGGGNDTLIGGAGHDILVGGSGNNVLYGGNGNDVYRIGLYEDGEAFDTIYDHAGFNALQFEGVEMSQLAFGMSGADAVIAVEGATRVRIVDYADGTFEVRAGDSSASLDDLLAGVLQAQAQLAAEPLAEVMMDDVLAGFVTTAAAVDEGGLDDVLAGYHEGEMPPEPEALGIQTVAEASLGQGYLFPDQMIATGEEAASGIASKPLDPHDPHYG